MDKEFDESKHPRDETGKFTEGVGTKAEQEKLKKLGIDMQEQQEKSNLTNEEKRLEELTGEKVENELTDAEKKQNKKESKKKKLAKKIANFQSITLHIKDKSMECQFDNLTANKNIHAKGNSDKAGYKFKQANLKKLREFVVGAKYSHSKVEEGKENIAHKGVKEWHYLKNTVETPKGKFNIFVNIRDKGKKQYIYEISFRKSKK